MFDDMKGLVRMLAERGMTITFAESCTGGLLAKLITDVPGASAVFKGSVVSYSAQVKESLLGVSPDTIQAHGEVSRETAAEMAQGARRLVGADIAVAVTGSAGPTPDEPGKPVGLIWIAAADKNGVKAESIYNDFPENTRERNRAAAAEKAVQMAAEIIR